MIGPQASGDTTRALVTANMDDENLRRLREDLGFEVEYRPIEARESRFSREQTIELLEDVEVFIVGFEGVSDELLDLTDSLKIIACTRGGPEANVDIAAATERNIPVLYAPGRNAVSVADFTLGLILSVSRNIAHSHHLLRAGEYTGEPTSDAVESGEREDVTWGAGMDSPYVHLKGPELTGKTLTIIGMGAIGKRVAERASGFGLECLGYDPFVDADEMAAHGVAEVTNLHEAVATADFVTLHVPVTDQTRGLIGPEEFTLMNDEAFFINTARGALIDQDALLEQLREGGIRGAALDVYDEEPIPEGHPLLELPNVVTTPHLAGAAEEVIERHSEIVVDGVAALLANEVPTHIANPDVLDAPDKGQ